MKLILQRVKYATLKIDNQLIAEIKKGIVCYIGFTENDNNLDYDKAIKKLCGIRFFEDENGKMNLNAEQINGEILIVPNFTLYADTSHGFRPSFINALSPDIAKICFNNFVNQTKKVFPNTQCGIFGADMKIEQLTDGPVNIIMEF